MSHLSYLSETFLFRTLIRIQYLLGFSHMCFLNDTKVYYDSMRLWIFLFFGSVLLKFPTVWNSIFKIRVFSCVLVWVIKRNIFSCSGRKRRSLTNTKSNEIDCCYKYCSTFFDINLIPSLVIFVSSLFTRSLGV